MLRHQAGCFVHCRVEGLWDMVESIPHMCCPGSHLLRIGCDGDPCSVAAGRGKGRGGERISHCAPSPVAHAQPPLELLRAPARVTENSTAHTEQSMPCTWAEDSHLSMLQPTIFSQEA